jgi:cysteine desulfurase
VTHALKLPGTLTRRALYLDNNATTPLAPEVLEEMMPYLTEQFGNASTIYQFGVDARYGVEKARRRVAKALHAARDEEILFTAGGSESDNLAIKGSVLARRERGRHIISCHTEHKAVLNTLAWLEEEHGCEVTWIPVGASGRVDPDDVRRAIREDTVLITLMFANSETGAIHPIAEVGEIARERGVTFHCDAVQAVGKEPLDVSALQVDLLSISGHKFNAPKGVGALYVRDGVALTPIIHGGGQERGLRAGTENVPGIVGLGRAIQLAEQRRPEEQARLRAMKERLVAGLQAAVDGIARNGDPERCLAGTVNLGITGIEGPRLVALAGEDGISIAAGSACTTHGTARSHVLETMGLPDEQIRGAVRISLGRFTTDEAIDHVLEVLPRLIRRLREAAACGLDEQPC